MLGIGLGDHSEGPSLKNQLGRSSPALPLMATLSLSLILTPKEALPRLKGRACPSPEGPIMFRYSCTAPFLSNALPSTWRPNHDLEALMFQYASLLKGILNYGSVSFTDLPSLTLYYLISLPLFSYPLH